MSKYKNFTQQFINGEWLEGSSTKNEIKVQNPFNNEELTRIKGASVSDVDNAFKAAKKAQVSWAELLPRERAEYLLKAAKVFEDRHDEIVQWLIKEAGATHYWANQITGHAAVCCSEAAHYAQAGIGKILPSLIKNQESHVYRKPIGVIGIITPWNSPINLTLRAVAPALAMGNAVVLKPANQTPVSGGLFHAKVFEEIALPKGLFNVTVGSSSEISETFNGNDIAGSISFTGSTRIGRKLMEQNANTTNIKRLGLELGGNAPLIVLDDADIDEAVNAIVFGRFLHQGQICMSTNRVLVHEKIHDSLVDKLKKRIEKLPYGDPNDPKTVVGPFMDNDAAENVNDIIHKAKEEGATIVVGGTVDGNVVPPHLLTKVRPEHTIFNTEIFGPVLPVIKFTDDEEAIELANRTEYGLASSVFGKNLKRAKKVANRIYAGMTGINDQTVLTDIYGPFGGEKNSGPGHFNGEWIIEEYTRLHWITIQNEPREYLF